jgi:hypothetical protein
VKQKYERNTRADFEIEDAQLDQWIEIWAEVNVNAREKMWFGIWQSAITLG